MNDDLGQVLKEYEQCLHTLRSSMAAVPALEQALFNGFDDWERLLTFKLAPRLGGEGCLIVAMAGGTNTGKSTVFNGLLGQELSPVSPYGAYTKHPVIAANAARQGDCLERGKLLPDAFKPRAWDESSAEAVSDLEQDPMTVFVARNDGLSDRMVLLDTPDVDSIVVHNWELAKSIREAGDIVIAVLTGQKYADSCVVEFFREAIRAGRYVVALMNMADDRDDDYAVTRQQLKDFARYLLRANGEAGKGDVEVDLDNMHAFVVPRLSGDEKAHPPQPVALDDSRDTLMERLGALDAVELKKRILGDSLERFVQHADDFIRRANRLDTGLGEVIGLVEDMAREASAEHEPVPGHEVITVVHDFIQERAGTADKIIGALSAKMTKIPGWLMVKSRAFLRGEKEVRASVQDINAKQMRDVEEIVQRLYHRYNGLALKRIADLLPEGAACFERGLKGLDPGEIARKAAWQALQTDKFVDAYRAYAFKELEEKWRDKKFRRMAASFYRLGLLGSGAGMLVLLWFAGWFPGGLVLSEVLVSLSVPVLEHTVARGAAYLWGDKLAGLVGRWRTMQREALEQALLEYLAHPALGKLPAVADALREHAGNMKELNTQCRNAC